MFQIYDSEDNTLDGVPVAEIRKEREEAAKIRKEQEAQKTANDSAKTPAEGKSDGTGCALLAVYAVLGVIALVVGLIVAIIVITHIWLFVGLALLSLLAALTALIVKSL